jgi:tetratricopeptide (TPR) repeat protein
MTNAQDEFVTIRPRQVALSHQNDAATRRPISIGLILVGAGLVLLIAIAVWVFMYLPARVERNVAATPAAAPLPKAAAAPAEVAAPPVVIGKPPYEEIQIERERKRAQETLARFVKLQIELDEKMHVRDWAAEPFDAAQQLANDGDALFTKQQFDDAMANYEKGITALEALRAQGETRFSDALAAAVHAIDQRDAVATEAACATAATVYPDDARIAEARSRAKRLPQIIELFDDADRAIDRNDWRTALAKYRAIQTLDPKTQGLQGPLNDAQSRVAELDHRGVLSAGYAALDAGDYDAARRAFDAALRQQPNDAAARDGMNQVEQRSTLSNIEQYHQRATRAEDEERWSDAVADYNKVLAVDGSIKFAMDGRARAGARADLDQKLNAAIADPGALSSDATFADVVRLYKDAVKITSPGPRLTDQLNRLEKDLAAASEPVVVTLMSDEATEVTLSQLGALGKFSRKEVKLRPGRYILLGSRDGRRDVRREIVVTSQMPPVEIVCQEAI